VEQRFNFSDSILTDAQELYLQTNTEEDQGRVISRLFKGGRLLGQKEIPLKNTMSGDRRHEYAEEFHMNNKTSLEELFRNAAASEVDDSASCLGRAKECLVWGLDKRALSFLEEAAAAYPTRDEVLLLRGAIFLRSREFSKALSAFSQGLIWSVKRGKYYVYIFLCLLGILELLQSVGGDSAKQDEIRNKAVYYLTRDEVISIISPVTLNELLELVEKCRYSEAEALFRKMFNKRLIL